jgi:hypothetical protein
MDRIEELLAQVCWESLLRSRPFATTGILTVGSLWARRQTVQLHPSFHRAVRA